MLYVWRRLLFVTSLTAVVAGCPAASGPQVHYVEGVVTLDGQPVEGANVSFSPVDKNGKGATGMTGANGVFKLTTIPDGEPGGGAMAGDYNVAFSKTVTSDPNAVTSSEDPNYGKSSSTGKTESFKSEKVIPEKYENPATSGFKVTVKAGENKGDAFKFDLKKD